MNGPKWMRSGQLTAVFAATTVLIGSATLVAAQDEGGSPTDREKRSNPLHRQWYVDQGVVLPRTFGVGINLIFMERDIAVTDVRVSFAGRPPESISDHADFDVRNRTMLSMIRFDAWVLPFFDLYVMAGQTRTETNLRTAFEITPPIGQPIPVEVETDQKVKGPLLGAGGTLVFGGDAWFAMVDANYSKSDLDSFEEEIDAWFISSRIGWHKTTAGRQYRAWGGIAYLDSRRSLTIVTELPVIGTTTVEVDQEPVNPVTYEIGGSLSLNRRWDILLEIGSNFDDAFLTVVSGSYRF